MILELGCVACKEVLYVVSVSPEQMSAWEAGAPASDAFPHLFPEQRDLLITGVCDDCWEAAAEDDEMWSDPEYYGLLDPESDDPSYDSDYYVDRDCD